MARIRSVKPEIRRSLTVSSWPYPVRWTFVGLPGYVDDEGRGLDDCRLVKAELYPLDDDMTAKKIDRHLAQIADNGPLCRYEVEGRRYFHLTSWAEHQRVNRPSPSVIPPCPVHEKDVSAHASLTDDSVSGHGAVSEPSPPSRVPAEQGTGKGTGNREQGMESARGTRLPDDWTPDQPLIDAMRHEGIPDDLARRELPRFRDYWAAQPGAKGRKADWPATWRNWLRRAADDPQGRPPPAGHQPSTADQRVTAGLALAAQLRAEEHPDRQEITA